ncbi:MAG: thioredoxin [Gemmatimonadales bacterium]
MSHPPSRRTAVVACPFCSTVNRVDLARLSDLPRCGQCRKPIRLDRPVAASEADFDQSVNGTAVPVLADFYADWCGPCKVTAPMLDELAHAQAGQVLVLKVDTDRHPALSTRFGIRGIPTIIAFRDGREVNRVVGVPRPGVLETLAGHG